MRPLVWWSLGALCIVASPALSPASGQRLGPPVFAPFVADLATGATVSRPVRLFPPAPDYRWEGLVVGGVIVGALGAMLGGGFCGYDDSAVNKNCTWQTIEGFVIGALVGGVTGGLLGSAIPKPPPDPSEDP
jgi:outer membrane lipoprotein SlyB